MHLVTIGEQFYPKLEGSASHIGDIASGNIKDLPHPTRLPFGGEIGP